MAGKSQRPVIQLSSLDEDGGHITHQHQIERKLQFLRRHIVSSREDGKSSDKEKPTVQV